MNILITGGTGFVGSKLVKNLLENTSHNLLLTTRSPNKEDLIKDPRIDYIKWNSKEEPFPNISKQIDGIINLMGENISEGRWSSERKKALRDSRIKGSLSLAEYIKSQENPPSFVLGASAIGIYPKNSNTELSEQAELGEDFLAQLCKDWEEASRSIPSSRSIIIRIGVVLGHDGGALNKLLPIFKAGLGGPIGRGKQMMSWVYVEDLVRAIEFLSFKEDVSGTFNVTAPNPVSNLEFSQSLANALSRPCLFPVPPFMLKLMFGEMSTIMLDSQTVLPKELEKKGFSFSYPKVSLAFEKIVRS